MADITYTWEIIKLECAPTQNQLTNVVRNIHWRLLAQEQGANGLSAETCGCVALDIPHPEVFTSYESLTQSVVEEWLVNKLNTIPAVGVSATNTYVSVLQDQLAQNIADQHNPPIIDLGFPWINAGIAST